MKENQHPTVRSAAEPEKRDGCLVVMTACIDPASGSHKVTRADPAVRLADYQQALDFWLKHQDPRLRRILLIDNSRYSLDALRRFADENNPMNKEVELLSFDCNYTPPGLGYGYPEFAMLDLGLPQSRLAAMSRYWIKTTGRLRFSGVSRLLDRLPVHFQFAVDFRENDWFVKWPQRMVTTQFMIFEAGFFMREMIGLKDDMKTLCIEDAAYDRLKKFRGQNGAILRWPVNVTPSGIAGHNKSYDSPRQRLINFSRAAARRLIPNWWV